MNTQTPDARARCRILYGAAIETVRELERGGLEAGQHRALLLIPTALIRPSELVAVGVNVRAGALEVPGSRCGGLSFPARTVPLGSAARSVLGGDGTLHELLQVAEHGRGGFLRDLRSSYAEVAPTGLETLEQLWSSLTAATIAAQADAATRHAIERYAGLASKARRVVAGDEQPVEAASVARFLDEQLRACSYFWDASQVLTQRAA
jgi:hypothetical protein